MEHAHEILILTQDRPELFARIVSNLQQYGLSIAEARIHTGRDGRVVDSFIVVDDGSDPNFEQEFTHFQEILAEKLDYGQNVQEKPTFVEKNEVYVEIPEKLPDTIPDKP